MGFQDLDTDLRSGESNPDKPDLHWDTVVSRTSIDNIMRLSFPGQAQGTCRRFQQNRKTLIRFSPLYQRGRFFGLFTQEACTKNVKKDSPVL